MISVLRFRSEGKNRRGFILYRFDLYRFRCLITALDNSLCYDYRKKGLWFFFPSFIVSKFLSTISFMLCCSRRDNGRISTQWSRLRILPRRGHRRIKTDYITTKEKQKTLANGVRVL